MRDWPGHAGPLVHVPDPLRPSPFVAALAAALAPRYRVLSVAPREDSPYQVQAADVAGVLAQFGFAAPTLVGEGYGCAAALIVAAWYPDRVGRLVLVDAVWGAPAGESLPARALRDCPPDVNALRKSILCPVSEPTAEEFLARPLP